MAAFNLNILGNFLEDLLKKNGKQPSNNLQENVKKIFDDPKLLNDPQLQTGLSYLKNKLELQHLLEIKKCQEDGRISELTEKEKEILASKDFLKKIAEAEQRVEENQNNMRDLGYDPDDPRFALALEKTTDFDFLLEQIEEVRQKLEEEKKHQESLLAAQNSMMEKLVLEDPSAPASTPASASPPAPESTPAFVPASAPAPASTPASAPTPESAPRPLPPTLTFTSQPLKTSFAFSLLHDEIMKHFSNEKQKPDSPLSNAEIHQQMEQNQPTGLLIKIKDTLGNVVSEIQHVFDPKTKTASINLTNPTEQTIGMVAQIYGSSNSLGPLNLGFQAEASHAAKVADIFDTAVTTLLLNDRNKDAVSNDKKSFLEKHPTALSTKLNLNPPTGTGKN